MKYICMECSHEFDEPGRTYADFDIWCTEPIGACPQCLSDDITPTDELEVKSIAPITVMPVSTDRLEQQARAMLARLGEDTQ